MFDELINTGAQSNKCQTVSQSGLLIHSFNESSTTIVVSINQFDLVDTLQNRQQHSSNWLYGFVPTFNYHSIIFVVWKKKTINIQLNAFEVNSIITTTTTRTKTYERTSCQYYNLIMSCVSYITLMTFYSIVQ